MISADNLFNIFYFLLSIIWTVSIFLNIFFSFYGFSSHKKLVIYLKNNHVELWNKLNKPQVYGITFDQKEYLKWILKGNYKKVEDSTIKKLGFKCQVSATYLYLWVIVYTVSLIIYGV
ncbi:MAG: hypothetical protein KAI43_14195 [Candidatus Aureabacteria bacterium]|nr:hypothetical protein [Candidatus Auribacterota bacterium]